MKTLIVIAILCTVCLVRADDKDQSNGPYAVWEPWIGGVWAADLPPGKDGVPLQEELTHKWCDNRQGIQSDIWIVKGKARTTHQTQLCVWNAAKKEFHLLAIDTEGNVKESHIKQEGSDLVSEVTLTAPDGRVINARGRMTLTSPNAGLFQMSASKGGTWVKVEELHLERQSEH